MQVYPRGGLAHNMYSKESKVLPQPQGPTVQH